MPRGFGEVEAIQNGLPEWFAVVFAALTQLGDVWFLAVLLATLYWRLPPIRVDIATLTGVWLAGIGLYNGLKELFSLPRPDRPFLAPELVPGLVRPLYEGTALAGGYGFPSGHAVNATVVYVGLASILAVSTHHRRYVAAGSIVATVCITRVALGVHYLVDVVAGVAVGALLLLGARTLTNRRPNDRPSIAFGLAAFFGVFFAVTSGVEWDAVVLLTASIGAFASWRLLVGR